MKQPIPVQAVCCTPVTAGAVGEAEAEELAAVLKALADPVRLRLVSLIAAAPAGEICACELPALLDRSQPTVSHHLTQLVRAGLLDREQRGKWAWFRLRLEGFAALCAALGGSMPSPNAAEAPAAHTPTTAEAPAAVAS